MGCPLRVLHVVVNMNVGGAETLIMNLYRNIDRSKVQFDFLTCKEGVFDAEILDMGGKIYRIPYVTDVGHYGYIKALDHFFASHPDYKIVHSHMDKMSGFVLRAAKKAGIPKRIAHSHSTNSEGGIIANIYKWYAGKFILSNASHLLACSKKASEWLFKKKAETAMIIKNGIDCNKFTYSPEVRRQIRKELNLSQDSFVIGHVGRFSQPKNHSFLIDIFAETIKTKQDSVLVLVGDGSLRLNIEKKAADLNLIDKVKFLGIRNDINRLLQAFDVFLFPSLYEGLPVTLIEAQAIGLPCVIADTITTEVDMETGLVTFMKLGNAQSWAKELMSRNKPFVLDWHKALKNRGYDIRESAKNIEYYYNKLVN